MVVLVLGQPQLFAGDASSPFTLARQGGILISVSLNGAGPFVMLLDTGANHSSVSEELAETLQLPVVARGTVQSAAGAHDRLITRIDRMVVGPYETRVMPSILPKAYLALAGDVQGVVGQDVLARLRYTIDYRDRRIVWHDQEPAGSGTVAVLPMTFREGLPVVELPQAVGLLSLVADSGTGGLVLFDRVGAGLPGMTTSADQVRLDTLHGTSLARSVSIDRFRVGKTTFRDFPAVLLKGLDSPAQRGDGLLPLHIFSRVTFDGPGGRLIVG